MGQAQVQKQAPTKQAEQTDQASAAKDLKAKGEEIKKSMDDLIDEIDGVLEENATEFVANYVQRGGQ